MTNPIDAMISDEWRRICGPYVKPPKMQQWKITAVPDFEMADTKAISDDIMRQISEATKPRRVLMEQAARMVFMLGYGPADCQIRTLRGVDSLREPSVETDQLLVDGEPCFEVKVERSPVTDYTITYTTTPRLIAWPPERPAPQVRASSDAGET